MILLGKKYKQESQNCSKGLAPNHRCYITRPVQASRDGSVPAS